MKVKVKLMQTVAGIIVATSIFLVITFVFWSLYPYNPLKINVQPLPVINKEVKRGDSLVYNLDYCKSTDSSVLISRSFIDGVIFSIPDVTAKNLKGCRSNLISLQVPESIPVGDYYLKVTYKYKVNPIRTMLLEAVSEKFTVIDN